MIAKKISAVLIYLFLISALLEFDLEKLLDMKQLLMVLVGMFLFYLPTYRKDHLKTPSVILQKLGMSAIWVSIIETFVLLFVLLQTGVTFDNLLYQISLNCRPMLYGFCIWTILYCESDGNRKQNFSQIESEPHLSYQIITAEQSYYLFLEMGLTKRECEIAVQICKGLSNGEIAEELCISEATVKKHISNMFEKLKISKREQLLLKLR